MSERCPISRRIVLCEAFRMLVSAVHFATCVKLHVQRSCKDDYGAEARGFVENSYLAGLTPQEANAGSAK